MTTATNENPIGPRLNEFRHMKNGWLEGEGLAPSHEGLDWLTASFEEHYPADLPNPHLFPMEEGGVRAEWAFGPNRIIMEIDLKSRRADWLWFHTETHAEEVREGMNMDEPKVWGWVAEQITREVFP